MPEARTKGMGVDSVAWAARCLVLAALLGAVCLGSKVYLGRQRLPAAQPLSGFPLQLGAWRGNDLPLEPRILEALQLHDYLNRIYINPSQQVVGLYVAYYPEQRFGDDIHSPKNCLPGAGWLPLQNGALAFDLEGQRVQVNNYLVARGSERELILYWFQQQGRVVRSEYSSKLLQIWSGLSRSRSDAALVRVAVPVAGSDALSQSRGIRFIQLFYPQLKNYIPN